MSEGVTQVTCRGCGGPLRPEGRVRVTCTYCNTVNDIASAGAVRVAKKLEALNIRVPDNPMTLADIEEELARKDRAKREQLRMQLIVAGVVIGLAALIAMLMVLS